MNKPGDSSFLSAEHFESIQLDLLKQEFKRGSTDELASLRNFNAQLLKRMRDFRQKNLELSVREDEVRAALAAREKREKDLERQLGEKERELAGFTQDLGERQHSFDSYKEDLNRRLAKISDEKWAKEIEIENLRLENEAAMAERESEFAKAIERARENAEQEIKDLRRQHALELESARTERSELAARIDDLENELRRHTDENQAFAASVSELESVESEQRSRIESADRLLIELEEALEATRAELVASQGLATQELAEAETRHLQLAETSRARESQLIAAFEGLRTEYSSIDKCYRESTETVAQLRAELRSTHAGAEKSVMDLRAQMEEELRRRLEPAQAENKRLQQRLDTRDTQLEDDRAKLQTWREQLAFLDQHLRRFSDSLKRDKAEVLRLAQLLTKELCLASQHPFENYVAAAELEISALSVRLGSTSELSPARVKLETRLAQAKEHKDALETYLNSSRRDLEEREKSLQGIIRSASQAV